jgi:hypothetical protein
MSLVPGLSAVKHLKPSQNRGTVVLGKKAIGTVADARKAEASVSTVAAPAVLRKINFRCNLRSGCVPLWATRTQSQRF